MAYASSFFMGLLGKHTVEEELRVAFNAPYLKPVSIRDFFKGESWKTIGEGMRSSSTSKAVGTALAKESAIELAAFAPGAVLGYMALDPVLTAVHLKDHPHKHAAQAAPSLPASTVTDAMVVGKVASEAQLEK